MKNKNRNTAVFSKNGKLTPALVARAAKKFKTPLYCYDESVIVHKCKELLNMPNAFGLRVRYAMKANSNRTILRIIAKQGLHIDASSLNEARRAKMAGISYAKIMLTTQEVPLGDDRKELEKMMRAGLKYNVCSLRQLELVAPLAAKRGIALSIRIHPGIGSGESSTRNTGDKYSCFGVHLSDIEKALEYAHAKKAVFDAVHVHIGSGGNPEKWRQNIDRELDFIKKYFPDAKTVNFGGGLREARMPDETPAHIQNLGAYAKRKTAEFYVKTGRKLRMEIEPGTYVVANAGCIVATVIDKKRTGGDGFEFVVLDGGMEMNSRPLLYGSRHPFFVITKKGILLSARGLPRHRTAKIKKIVVVGRCCESGDSQTLDGEGNIKPRNMADPEIGDYVVIGGAGAYCSAMAPFNYNSHVQAPEVLLGADKKLTFIRKRQILSQILHNEMR